MSSYMSLKLTNFQVFVILGDRFQTDRLPLGRMQNSKQFKSVLREKGSVGYHDFCFSIYSLGSFDLSLIECITKRDYISSDLEGRSSHAADFPTDCTWIIIMPHLKPFQRRAMAMDRLAAFNLQLHIRFTHTCEIN